MIQINDFGVDNSQYFQGDSAMYTSFDNCEVGCGSNFKEAVEDALESIAQQVSSADFDVIEKEVYADADYLSADTSLEAEGDEMYYYVSIYYNLPEHIKCDQCEAAMINGVFCHETGCPNAKKTYDAENGRWVKYVECRECGEEFASCDTHECYQDSE